MGPELSHPSRRVSTTQSHRIQFNPPEEKKRKTAAKWETQWTYQKWHWWILIVQSLLRLLAPSVVVVAGGGWWWWVTE